MICITFFAITSFLTILTSSNVSAQPGKTNGLRHQGKGGGHGGMGGHREAQGGWGNRGGKGGGGGGGGSSEMDLIQSLVDHHGEITRDFNITDDGIVSFTSSKDPAVASWIQQHVYQMMQLMATENEAIRLWDPVFEKAFELRDFHELDVTNTTTIVDGLDVALGVHVEQFVVEIDDKHEAYNCTKAVIQAHAGAVSRFVEYGRSELSESHPAPNECD